MAGGVLTWAGGGLREPTASLEQGRGEGGLRRRLAVGGGRCTVGIPPRSGGAGLGRAVSGGRGSSPAWPDSVALGGQEGKANIGGTVLKSESRKGCGFVQQQ